VVPDDQDHGAPTTTLGAGAVDTFRVEFAPTSQDKRFGRFQFYVEGVPIGDGTTTALYPHFMDFHKLCQRAEQPGLIDRDPLHLGDTFDHLIMSVEITPLDIVFLFTTHAQWGDPPPWAPPVGEWMRLSVTRARFITTWHQAAQQFQSILSLE
jgi:hypothetical protein